MTETADNADRSSPSGAGPTTARSGTGAADEAILVPVLNEEGVIGSFLAELAPYAANRRVYLLDSGSHDATVAEAQAVAHLDLEVVRCDPGLATAIRRGIEQSSEQRLAVIDGDGQHDPRVLSKLFGELDAGYDLAVASRLVAGATVASDWPWHRQLFSTALLSAVRLGVRCHGVRDPFAGCFALRREAWTRVSNRFDTGGYKFLLDFLAASRSLRVTETPLSFRARRAGASKLNFAVLWELLVSVASGSLRGRIPRSWLSFGAVGTVGTATDAILTGTLYRLLGMPFALARPLAILAAMTQNYLLNNNLTFSATKHRGRRQRLRGWATYVVCQTVGAAANWGVSVSLYSAGLPWFIALLAGVAAGIAVNLAAALKFVWRRSPSRRQDRQDEGG